MTEMKYSSCSKRTILDEGKVEDYQYMIISMGTHPCAYVRMPEDCSLKETRKAAERIWVHGGITFIGALEDGAGRWIGWDYAHQGDAFGETFAGHRYTVSEIVGDVKNVIRHLHQIFKGEENQNGGNQ